MGFIETMIANGERLIQENTRKEFLKAGSIECNEMLRLTPADSIGKRDIPVSRIKHLFSRKGAPEQIWIYSLANNGITHWYIQPCARTSMPPGEHHAILEGAVPAAAGIERAGFFSNPRWWCDNPSLAAALTADRVLGKAARKARWAWYTAGRSRVEYECPLQMRNLGGRRVHLAMRSSQYPNRTRVGFQVLIDVSRALAPHLASQPEAPAGGFRAPFVYAELITAALARS